VTTTVRLTTHQLWCRRGSDTVFKELNLELRSGELVLLQGPNGSGKTTLLETLAGLLRPASGEIRLDGWRSDGQRPDRIARRGLVLVHQERYLFSTLSVRSNLALADFAGRSDTGTDSVDETLERFGIERLASTPAGLLSGGEQRLVALARGLRARPRVALLDEPLAALAAGLRERVLAELRRLADRGTAVLVVEHDGQRVEPYANRSLSLRDGVLLDTAMNGSGIHHH
jgi:ABC-type branched-subunit amino acid transport system ATPase component